MMVSDRGARQLKPMSYSLQLLDPMQLQNALAGDIPRVERELQAMIINSTPYPNIPQQTYHDSAPQPAYHDPGSAAQSYHYQ